MDSSGFWVVEHALHAITQPKMAALRKRDESLCILTMWTAPLGGGINASNQENEGVREKRTEWFKMFGAL